MSLLELIRGLSVWFLAIWLAGSKGELSLLRDEVGESLTDAQGSRPETKDEAVEREMPAWIPAVLVAS